MQVEVPLARKHYRRIWHGMDGREDQDDDLLIRSGALARRFSGGVLRVRSAALLRGDDSAPERARPSATYCSRAPLAFLDGPEGSRGVGQGGQAALAAMHAERRTGRGCTECDYGIWVTPRNLVCDPRAAAQASGVHTGGEPARGLVHDVRDVRAGLGLKPRGDEFAQPPDEQTCADLVPGSGQRLVPEQGSRL